HPPILTDSQVRTPNAADGDGTPRLMIDLERFGESGTTVHGADVEDVPSPGITAVGDQVDDPLAVHSDLGLNASVADPLDRHLGRGFRLRGAWGPCPGSHRTCSEHQRCYHFSFGPTHRRKASSCIILDSIGHILPRSPDRIIAQKGTVTIPFRTTTQHAF